MGIFWRGREDEDAAWIRWAEAYDKSREHNSAAEESAADESADLPARTLLDDEDWIMIGRLLDGPMAAKASLSGPRPVEPNPCRGVEPGSLESAINAVLERSEDKYLSVDRLINPLLDLWAVAHQLSPGAAAPVESMLRILAHRQLVALSEVKSLCEELRASLASSG